MSGAHSITVCQKILTERGEDISQDFLLELKERRINDLSNPDDILHLNSKNIFVVSKMYVILGYLSSLLGGILGIIMDMRFGLIKKHFQTEIVCQCIARLIRDMVESCFSWALSF